MDRIFTLAAQGFSVAFTAALLFVPLCIALALRAGVVDKPGGRKQHGRVTPLLGGVGVFAAVAAGLGVVQWQTAATSELNLHFEEVGFVMAAALIMLLIGLVDDVFKDRMAFQLKLLGQIVGVLVLMGPQLGNLISHGGEPAQWLYQLFFLGWYLTIVNSFNFSDNMNGLMAGLSIIAFAASVVYLGSENSVRSLVIAVVLVGALLGFMPYNFPRSRVFLGDAGSMFVGFLMAWIELTMSRGFLGEVREGDLGFSNLIPAILIMGVPLYDAAFVVFMRIVERRPIYLGDNHHLSHRLVRGGFTAVEAVVILWGIGILLAGVGVLAVFAQPSYRYLLLAASVAMMVAVTRVIMHFERRALAASAPPA